VQLLYYTTYDVRKQERRYKLAEWCGRWLLWLSRMRPEFYLLRNRNPN